MSYQTDADRTLAVAVGTWMLAGGLVVVLAAMSVLALWLNQ